MDSLEISRRQLADSEEKYRVIFEQALEGMFRTHMGKGLVAVNPAMAKMFGYADPKQMMAEIADPAKQLYVAPAYREQLLLNLAVTQGRTQPVVMMRFFLARENRMSLHSKKPLQCIYRKGLFLLAPRERLELPT